MSNASKNVTRQVLTHWNSRTEVLTSIKNTTVQYCVPDLTGEYSAHTMTGINCWNFCDQVSVAAHAGR